MTINVEALLSSIVPVDASSAMALKSSSFQAYQHKEIMYLELLGCDQQQLVVCCLH
jgi:hypothetical protein